MFLINLANLNPFYLKYFDLIGVNVYLDLAFSNFLNVCFKLNEIIHKQF